MLDIDLLRSELAARSDLIAESLKHTSNGLSTAVERMRTGVDVDEIKTAVKAKGESSFALPLDQDPQTPKSLNGFRKDQSWTMEALAEQFVGSVDGSQIYPEGHLRFACALVNVGSARFHYVDPVEYLGVSKPRLLVGDELLTWDGNTQHVISKEDLDRTRLEMEVQHAKEILESAKPQQSFLYMDGPLIYSFLDPRTETSKRRIIKPLMDLLQICDQKKVYIVGYLAASRAADWINSLRYSLLCGRIPTACDRCISECKGIRNVACFPLIGLTDSSLYNRILEIGARSSVFSVERKILKHYKTDSTDYSEKISAFYLKIGQSEVARLELPYFDWMSDEDIERIQRVTLAQTILGFGYPYALTRAHEKAVVTSSEKDGFYDLVDRHLTGHFAINLHESSKRRMKRESIL